MRIRGFEIALLQWVTPTTFSRRDFALIHQARVRPTALRERSVDIVDDRREWDVTVRPRVEGVTDLEDFPELLRAALAVESASQTLQLNLPSVPHSTSAIVRVRATSKEDAENQARDSVFRALYSIARTSLGEQAVGWTVGLDAVLSGSSPNLVERSDSVSGGAIDEH